MAGTGKAVLWALGVAAALAGCGGGGGTEAEAAGAPSSVAAAAAGDAPRRILAAAPGGGFEAGALQNAVAPVPLSADDVMTWAEATFPQFFPSRRDSQAFDVYLFRYYPESGNYLGIDGNVIRVLGPISNNQILEVGRIADYACQIRASDCGPKLWEGRQWRTAQLIETDDNAVESSLAVMDDDGRATIVFLKSNGSRDVLYAVQATPGAAGTGGSFSAPRAIDNTATANFTTMGDYVIGGSAGGRVAVVWRRDEACTATTYRTSGTCRYLYLNTYDPGSGWATPARLTDSPDSPTSVAINDRGDIAIRMTGWVREGSNSHDARPAMGLRPSGGSFAVRNLPNALAEIQFGIDEQGQIVIGGELPQAGTRDMVVYRGSVANGWGNGVVLDTRGNEARFRDMIVGRFGQSMIVWDQNDGTRTARFAAWADSAAAAFGVSDIGAGLANSAISTMQTRVTDAGVGLIYDFSLDQVRRVTRGVWSSVESLPRNYAVGSLQRSFTRNGDFASVRTTGCNTEGSWSGFEASRNAVVKPFATAVPADYLIGMTHCNANIGSRTPVVSVKGHALTTLRNSYDVLPTPAAPSGDSRRVTNLWALYLN